MAELTPAPRTDGGLRLAAAGLAIGLAVAAYLLQGRISPRVQGIAGIICFISVVAAFSRNLKAVSWRTV